MTDAAPKYSKKIQRAEPGLIVLILDDSGSMADPMPGTSDPKFLWVERYTGLILQELLARSTEVTGDRAVVKPRYFVKTIVYGSKAVGWPNGANDELSIEQMVTEFASSQGKRANSLGLGGHLAGTDAAAAFSLAEQFLTRAVGSERYRASFPPMVFHLSDGASATDASPIADRIKKLATSDGETLIINAFIGVSTMLNYTGPDDFPGYQSATEAGPDPDSIRMFDMSSVAPDTIRTNLVEDAIFPAFRHDARLYFDVRTKEMLKHVIQSVGSSGSRGNR